MQLIRLLVCSIVLCVTFYCEIHCMYPAFSPTHLIALRQYFKSLCNNRNEVIEVQDSPEAILDAIWELPIGNREKRIKFAQMYVRLRGFKQWRDPEDNVRFRREAQAVFDCFSDELDESDRGDDSRVALLRRVD